MRVPPNLKLTFYKTYECNINVDAEQRISTFSTQICLHRSDFEIKCRGQLPKCILIKTRRLCNETPLLICYTKFVLLQNIVRV